MTDLNTKEDEGIPSDYLGDALKLLGVGGGATGILLGPRSFMKLGGGRSMHPAVAAEQGWKGALTHPDAVAEQRNIDNHILQNFNFYSQLTDPTKLHAFSGWQFGPGSGLMREVPDTGANLDIGTHAFYHPAGDLFNTLQATGPIYKDLGKTLGTYHSHNRNIFLNKDLSKYGPYSNLPHDLNKSLTGVTLHELMHAEQNPPWEGLDRWKQRYRWDLDWPKRPMEMEARGVENRFFNPDLYKIPFSETANILNYNNLVSKFLNKGNK